MKWKVVATARRGSLQVPEELSDGEAIKAQAQLDRDRGMHVEHGVRIPYWSNEARVIWNPNFRVQELERSDEHGPRVRRLVASAVKRGLA
jgi:hypothetical protein